MQNKKNAVVYVTFHIMLVYYSRTVFLFIVFVILCLINSKHANTLSTKKKKETALKQKNILRFD